MQRNNLRFMNAEAGYSPVQLPGTHWLSAAGRLARDLFRLTKPGISIFIGLTAATGALFAPGVSATMVLWATVAAYLSSSGSAAFNQAYEADLDRSMKRTRERPIASGVLAPAWGYGVSALLVSAGITLAFLYIGFGAALYLTGGAVSYVLLYTVWLKRRTAWNVPVGGLCGMFAALAGAAPQSPLAISQAGLVYAALLYLWSAPHFWSLALVKADDYRSAGVPMLPVTAGPRRTAGWITAHTVALVATPLMLWQQGFSFTLVVATGSGLVFLLYAIGLQRQVFASSEMDARVTTRARKTFFFSLAYLPLVFVSVWADFLF